MVDQNEVFAQLKSSALNQGPKPFKASFLQLVGQAGSGCRRLAFRFVQPAKRVAWISRNWNIYAPLLWKIAEAEKLQILGIESPDKNRFRLLCRELLEAQVFDTWILDNLRLHPSDGHFLHKLLRPHAVKILVIEPYPLSFCHERAHIVLSHHSYRVTWSKGGNPTPLYFPTPFESHLNPDVCRN